MEVTRSNFNEILPKVQEAIKNASFICIDCEFTGLNTVSDINAFDTPEQYYQKVRNTSKDFLVIQYGISIFRFESENSCFKQQSYTFYIFRRPLGRNLADQRFLCQTSSIDFLITNGFDFNKLFKEGISYLNFVEETKYKENLEEMRKHRANISSNDSQQNHVSTPKDDKPFVDRILNQISKFVEDGSDEQVLPQCNAFIRRLIYQNVKEKLKNKVNLETRTVNGDRVLVVTKPKSKQEKIKDEQKRVETELEGLENALGFTKVLRAIVNSEKLVVGHNMCLDILHSIDKFLTPLPDSYEEFKDCARGLFTRILDTKLMCTCEAFRSLIPSNVLGHLLKKVQEEPFSLPQVEVEEGFQGYSLREEKSHEAGYDAYITGLCLLGMWEYLGRQKGLTKNDTFKNFDILECYMNKLFLMRLQESPYINLAGDDPNPSKDHVFYLTFPKDWKTSDIVQLFSPFGNVSIGWINSTSAYVGLQRKDQSAIVLRTLSQSDTYSIMTYSKRQAQLLTSETVPASLPQQSNKFVVMKPPISSSKAPKKNLDFKETIVSTKPQVSSDTACKRSLGDENLEEENETKVAPLKKKNKKLKVEGKLSVSKKSGKKRTASKTFEEDNSWD